MEVWVLTREINKYNQEGEYFEKVFFEKPTSKELSEYTRMSKEYCEEFIIRRKGRRTDHTWYNLYEFKK